MTKAQERYSSFLRADFGCSFAEYLGIDIPQLDYYDGKYRYSNWKKDIYGDYCNTKREAKISYKKKCKNERS